MQLLSQSLLEWVTEEESVADMKEDHLIDQLHKHAELYYVLSTERFSS